MIKHVVVIKFKKGTEKSGIDKLENILGALPSQISEIINYEFGCDILRSERSYDFAIVSVFESLETLGKYLVHPKHQEVAGLIKEMSDSTIVVDFVL
ncbi:MAG: Dabb family protein [Desulfobacterium sp.]|nr:Dabb family protein [Desulfobacterium sp.]MBU3950029.1 Dabb family protein [Pseudomonadota bacterium]MBU4011095.1 Dabb family protein [Pseudomonadota bacterium]MBU4037674.1 Dabb family protein [Pseudomonadota bacterium]